MKHLLFTKFSFLLLGILLLGAAIPARAQDQDNDRSGNDDPPGRAARLTYINGSVSFQPGGVDDWALATVNRPLTTADRVWTDVDARAEISFGDGVARMSSETSLTLTNVADNTVQLELDQGALNIHIRNLYGGEVYEVDTPNVAFMLEKGGDYRIDVDPNGDRTIVTVRRGEGEANGNGPGVRIHSGDQVTFTGGNSMEHYRAEASRPDGFDDWCRARDERQDRAVSARYVPDGMVGYEDLDEYGGWRDEPTYGAVWYPRVAAGWAPYHYGHWAWIDPWGWTWVDDSPWGFAPFHYGRWAYIRGAWGWCPGPRPVVGVGYVRPVYAPALVAFIGGDNFRIGVSIGGGGGVGWVPLGWGEPYYPSYRVSPVYVRNVNVTNTHITNITYVTNNYTVIKNSNNTKYMNYHYNNQNVAGAVTAVPRSAFVGGQPVSRVAVRVQQSDVAKARFTPGPQVVPQRESVLGGREVVRFRPPERSLERRVITRTAPPPPPARFDAKQPLLQQTGGRPLTKSETVSLPRVQRVPGGYVNNGRPGAPGGNPNPAMRDQNQPGAQPGQNAARPGSPRPGYPGGQPPAATVANPSQPGRNTPVVRPPQQGSEVPRPGNVREIPRPPQRGEMRPGTDGNGEAIRNNPPNREGHGPFVSRPGSVPEPHVNNNVPRPGNPPEVHRLPVTPNPEVQRREPAVNNRPVYTPRQENNPPRQDNTNRPSYNPPPQRQQNVDRPTYTPPPQRQENVNRPAYNPPPQRQQNVDRPAYTPPPQRQENRPSYTPPPPQRQAPPPPPQRQAAPPPPAQHNEQPRNERTNGRQDKKDQNNFRGHDR